MKGGQLLSSPAHSLPEKSPTLRSPFQSFSLSRCGREDNKMGSSLYPRPQMPVTADSSAL